MTSLDEVLHLKQQRIDELHRLRPGRTALVVIDMQHGFLDPGAALEVPQGRGKRRRENRSHDGEW
jgi:hypothetical protein